MTCHRTPRLRRASPLPMLTLFAATLVLVVTAAPADAAAVRVAPTRITLPATGEPQALTLGNDSDSWVLVQAETFLWTQAEDGDRLEPTADLIVSPPIFRIEPGGSQIVRIGLDAESPADSERGYRLFLTQVMQGRDGGDDPAALPGTQGSGLRFALRLSIPVFALPAEQVEPRVEWRLEGDGESLRGLVLENRGRAHLHVTSFTLTAEETGEPVASASGVLYVLAGRRRAWPVGPGTAGLPIRPGATFRLTAQTDRGPVETVLRAPGA